MEPTLVVLAAGIGSRYGGTKQLDTFGPNGETIIDYSVYDAIRAGFKKVVFVIRKNIEEEFKQQFMENFQDRIQVEYVFQELDNLPDGLTPPPDRVKPWGTGHAVMVTEPKVAEPFAIINADDFYGASSFQLIYDHLKSLDPQDCLAETLYCLEIKEIFNSQLQSRRKIDSHGCRFGTFYLRLIRLRFMQTCQAEVKSKLAGRPPTYPNVSVHSEGVWTWGEVRSGICRSIPFITIGIIK